MCKAQWITLAGLVIPLCVGSEVFASGLIGLPSPTGDRTSYIDKATQARQQYDQCSSLFNQNQLEAAREACVKARRLAGEGLEDHRRFSSKLEEWRIALEDTVEAAREVLAEISERPAPGEGEPASAERAADFEVFEQWARRARQKYIDCKESFDQGDRAAAGEDCTQSVEYSAEARRRYRVVKQDHDEWGNSLVETEGAAQEVLDRSRVTRSGSTVGPGITSPGRVGVGPLPPRAVAGRYQASFFLGFFSDNSLSFGAFKDQAVYGFRYGRSLGEDFLIEGSLGYIGDFELEGTDPDSRGLIMEGSGSYEFLSGRFRPYVIGGIGAIRAFGGNRASPGGAPLNPNLGPDFPAGRTFSTFSYGGGVKAYRLAGPVGLRAEVRARTLPDVLGESTTWLEGSIGFLFTRR